MAEDPPEWLTRWLSRPRLATFLTAASGDAHRALALYTWNSRVSAALLRDLADVEVLVRNAYDRAIETLARSQALAAGQRISDTSPAPERIGAGSQLPHAADRRKGHR